MEYQLKLFKKFYAMWEVTSDGCYLSYEITLSYGGSIINNIIMYNNC